MATDELVLVGAAFPRTGTMSVKQALEHLGLGPCYHMHEVFRNPEHIEIWHAVCDGQMPDWRTLLAGYTATLDTPACHYWQELARCFPQAKVLLLSRDPQSWYESMCSTIHPMVMSSQGKNDPALAMVHRLFFQKHMNGRFEDRDYAVAVYQRYCAQVRETLPPERLLDFEVSQGWEPLCNFLGCRVPDQPFPMRNTRSEFRERSSQNNS